MNEYVENTVRPVDLKTRIKEYEEYLKKEERSENTISKYVRDVKSFIVFLGNTELGKEVVLQWKQGLTENYAPSSVNSMLAAVNGFLQFSGYSKYQVKPLKIQRELFLKQERELSLDEYKRLIQAAELRSNKRLSLLLQTICATGIRVSEVSSMTVEAVRYKRAEAVCKGKRRTVFLPEQLRRLLQAYCRLEKIKEGYIFCTKDGRPLNRSNIWRDMKQLCRYANVDESKVFPHNLRHLFARTYYAMDKDITRLADILGHSNINTTRIYTMESGREHVRQLERMGLVYSIIKKDYIM